MATLVPSFSIPAYSPLYPSPPCRYTASEFQLVSMSADPQAVAQLVPDPLVPNPDGQLVLMINRLHADAFGRYRELALLVPSTFEGTAGNYTAFMVLDRDSPLAAGREIWGWPKKLGVLEIEGDASIRTVVRRDDHAIIEANAELTGELRPDQLAFNPTFFNLKLIPSIEQGAPPDVMQLTSTTLTNIEIERARGGTATVVLRSGPDDALGPLSPRQVHGVACVQMNVTLGFGHVLHDYRRTT